MSNYDREYLCENDIYGLIIVFSHESLLNYCKEKDINIKDSYELIKPKYPWTENIKKLIDAYK